MSDIPPHVRILIPEWTRSSSGNSQHDPKGTSELAGDASKILEHNSEFLEVAVRESSRCNALGTSLGGGLLYFLRAQNPHKIQRTALVAPVIPSVLAEPLVSGLSERSNPFLEFGDRDDVQSLVRNHLWTDPRRRTGKDTDDPLPDVLYEALYQSNAATKSKGVLQDQLFDHARGVANDGETTTNVFSTTSDLDPDCRRLLVWPEDDQISSLESGRRFFGPSLEAGNTRLVTVSECGHVFDAQRRLLMERVAPEVQDFLLEFSQEQ
jgi:pimeloyl-ACP methyl ester carboxylesterase